MIHKRLFILVAVFFYAGLLHVAGQSDKGISFEQELNWSQIKAKAKSEGKNIFVDCYATWCGPCKKMDEEVYTDERVGSFFNKNFISVKVQIDSTGKDNERVKSWRTEARNFQQSYNVTGLPTFLFFSPDGKLVHRGIGYQDATAFAALGAGSLDPNKQFYSQVTAFKNGKLAFTEMRDLAISARAFNELGIADAVSSAYISNYLLQLSESELYTKDNLLYMGAFIKHSSDKGFAFFYKNSAKIDGVVQLKEFASGVIQAIIEQEEINDRYYKNGKPFEPTAGDPDWKQASRNIKIKYNADYAGRVVLWAKIKWLEHKKDWDAYTKNMVLKVEKYGAYLKFAPYDFHLPYSFYLNECAWEVFLRSTNRSVLKTALKWSKQAVDSEKDNGALVDTYANILYKLGNTQEAIANEEKAVQLRPGDPAMPAALAKMKKGEPTWK